MADTIAAPLLAGVFGGDIATLSVRAVMPAFVALEREHGSLILGLQKWMRAGNASASVFTTLRRGLASLIDGMESHIPARNIQRGVAVESIERNGGGWSVRGTSAQGKTNQAQETFDAVLVATPASATAKLLEPLGEGIGKLLPQQSSSAIVVALGFTADQAQAMRIPRGFGFLVSQTGSYDSKALVVGDDAFGGSPEAIAQRALLACTFVNQKFSHRTPDGAVLLRAFFGGPVAPTLLQQDDDALTRFACAELGRFLGKLPEPSISLVRRWPNSLPLYLVGHLDRMAELDVRVSHLPNLRLIGNAYRGVGLPDLIHSGRMAARELAASLTRA